MATATTEATTTAATTTTLTKTKTTTTTTTVFQFSLTLFFHKSETQRESERFIELTFVNFNIYSTEAIVECTSTGLC